MIGQTISHYEITEKLGEGGMGVVYKAWDSKLQRHVALKFLPSTLLSDHDHKSRFLREAHAAAGIDHANVCAVHAIETVGERTFIVMAYIDGQNLDNMIRSRTLSVEMALDLTAQIARGLARAHKKGIVHRDIKPANVRVTPDNEAKVVDFGLARTLDQARLTQSGMHLGTVAYMSPEQALGQEIDSRSDIFSLGIVLYEMLTGKLPFKGDINAALLYGIVNLEPPPLSESGAADLSPAVQEVLDRMLAKDRSARYASADEVAKDVERILHGDAPRLRVTPGRRWRRWVPIATVAAAAVAVAAWLVPWSDHEAPGEIGAQNRVAIMPFTNVANPTDDSNLGEIVSTLLTTGLSQSRVLGIISNQRIRDIFETLGAEGVSPTEMAVASTAGARWMIEGSILQSEPHIVITAQTVDVHSGNVISSHRVTGAPDETVFSLVDRLITDITRDSELPTAKAKEEYHLVTDVTTHSGEAYRLYLKGIRYQAAFHHAEAKEAFQAAVAEDTTFAMAYLALSRCRSSREETDRALASAVRHASRLNMKERNYVESQRLLREGDVSGALVKLDEIIAAYPDEKHAYFSLGNIYMVEAANIKKAIYNLERACELDPRNTLYWNQLAYARHSNDDHDGAIDAINRVIALAPDEFAGYDSRGDMYAKGGNLARAIDSYRRGLELNPDSWETRFKVGYLLLFNQDYADARKVFSQNLNTGTDRERVAARAFLARIPLFQGKLRDGLHELSAALDADETEGVTGHHVWALHARSAVHAAMGDLDAAIEDTESVIHLMEQLYPQSVTQYRDVLVQFLCRDGQTERADSVLSLMAELIPPESTHEIIFLEMARGLCSLEIGDYDSACKHLEAHVGSEFYARYPLGIAYLMAGRFADATRTLEAASTSYTFYRAIDPIAAIEVYYYLGRAYEGSGWIDRAIAEYQRFLDIWKDADPGIATVEDARQRLARLAAEG